MFDEGRITDPIALAKYAEAAREIYHDGLNFNVEIAQPPVAIQFNSGAKVMCWLPVISKPYVEEAHRLYVDEPMTAIEIESDPIVREGPGGAQVQAWLPIEDEDVWQ